MKRHSITVFIFCAAILMIFAGWGGTAHKMINYNSTIFLPTEMSAFSVWNYQLQSHASDADNRKNSDPTEDTKHYIDIDEYSEFNTTGKIPQDINVLITKYGASFVIDNVGILPWATITAVDSLRSTFKRRDWNKAIQFASDLGHYVGDGHMPLHITKNYDGKLTGQSGIHSRYETSMINTYSSQITFSKSDVEYISNVPDFVFGYIYGNYSFVDSVLAADKLAKASAGGSTSSTAYYQALWDRTKGYTGLLLNAASKRLAALMYTAWVDAGKPDLNSTFVENMRNVLNGFELYQNYPNPFNPSTVIKFSTFTKSYVKLKIFGLTGKEILSLTDGEKPAGTYEYRFDGAGLPSGVYFYTISSGNNSVSKKMVLMR